MMEYANKKMDKTADQHGKESGKKRIVLGISGASGVRLGYHIAKALVECGIELHLILTDAARLTWTYEMETDISILTGLADYVHEPDNIAASISSGSYWTDGMIVAPCSMKSLAGIVTGYTDNLLLRAADVCLKEGRKVVLCPREMPFGKIHLRNLLAAADAGCTIIPPMLSFYSHQQTMEDQLNHITGKVLMQFGIEYKAFHSWEGEK